MATQFIEDPETGETISFEWDQDSDPTGDDIAGLYQAVRSQGGDAQQEQAATPTLADKLSQRGDKIADIYEAQPSDIHQGEPETLTESFTRSPSRTLRVAGQVAGGINDMIGAGIETAYDAIMPEGAKKAISDFGARFADSGIGKSVLQGITTLRDAYRKTKETFPEGMENIEAVANIASVAPIGWAGTKTAKVAGEVASPYLRATGDLAGDVVEAVTRKSPEEIEKAIDLAVDKGINKGIRPTVVGKGTATQIDQYKERAKTAVKEIIGNRDNLVFADADGNVIKGVLPKSLNQFTDAIDQTKRGIFTQYDDMAKAAGEQGGKVDLKPVVKELDNIAQQATLQDLHPEIVKYATTRAEALTERGAYSTTQAQDAITQLNKSLESFYKNPSYENAQKAGIDAIIANNLRKSLDSVIETTKGSGYQALKNSYGSLKTIEKEVAHRAIVDARKNIKGLIDFTDIYTIGELMAGLATMSPGMVVKGAIGKAAQKYIKAMNNPNRIVRNMFEDVDRLLKKGTKRKSRWEPEPPDTSGVRPTPLALPMPERGFTLKGEPYGGVLHPVKPPDDIIDAQYTTGRRAMLDAPRRDEILQLTGQGFELPRGVWAMKSNAKMRQAFKDAPIDNMTDEELLMWIAENAR